MRFSLRSLILAIVLLSAVFAIVRVVISQTPALRFIAPDDCDVFLDDTYLGSGSFALSVDRAIQLRIPLNGNLKYEWFAHGAYLSDLVDSKGHIPLLHLRPRQGMAHSHRTVVLNGGEKWSIVALRSVDIHYRRATLVAANPLAATDPEDTVQQISDRIDGSTRKFALRVVLPSSLKQIASARGGIALYIGAVSLHDGSYVHSKFVVDGKWAERTIEASFPSRAPGEDFVLYHTFFTLAGTEIVGLDCPYYHEQLFVRQFDDKAKGQ